MSADQRISESEVPPDLLSLSTMTLATAAAGGTPHAAPVYFAADDSLAFYFFSEPDSLHSRHLQLNPQAAAAIYPECFHWQEIRGLQMHGRVITVPQGPDWQAAWRCYVDKFHYVAGLGEVVGRSTLYAFQPGWIRMVDNRRGFGFKQEWALP